ncbi:SseB family protein [Arsenicicoccus dermatophilus]|uniref:SseB family protein n=1 Tax=Arsenicicoccus dermatophilus TaxID=1076331 RepID=UPI003916D97F
MAGHDAAHGHDSGGVPWHGRDLAPNPFSRDTGAVDPALAAALATDETHERALVRAVAGARTFVPVVAAPGESAEVGTDSVAEMATVVLTGPDGQRALPAFSSLRTLAAWDSSARPVPVTAVTLAQAAVQEGCEAILLDLGDDRGRVLRASMVYALAQSREWVPAAEDPTVLAALGRARDEVGSARLHEVRAAGLAPSGALRVEVVLDPGLPAPELDAVLGRLGALLARDVELRTRLDGLTFTLVPYVPPTA